MRRRHVLFAGSERLPKRRFILIRTSFFFVRRFSQVEIVFMQPDFSVLLLVFGFLLFRVFLSSELTVCDEDVRGRKREEYLSWEEYFMAVACLAAQRSKDPVTQVIQCRSSFEISLFASCHFFKRRCKRFTYHSLKLQFCALYQSAVIFTKSIVCIHTLSRNLQRQRKVLYVSLTSKVAQFCPLQLHMFALVLLKQAV